MPDEKFNILYVDDEENNLISFKAAFRRKFNVFTAPSAEEGLKILHEEKVPIIITDQRMPGVTGVQFLEKIIPEFPDSIRMILTGFSDIEAIIQAINTGRVFRYITKPWDEQELEMTINNAINLYSLKQSNKQLLDELNQKVHEQEKTLNLFKRYVPPAVVEKSLEQDEASIFDGELKEVSVMFCDIRNFTELSAELDPKEVVQFLNYFYAMMSECIREHNGFVCQFIGDEIFAIFGAPLSYPENHTNAVFAAIDMMRKLKDVNAYLLEHMHHQIEIGIGINTGEVVAGNLGTKDKIAYSITGDTVNTGKRIETLTKDAPNTILISNRTFESAPGLFLVKSWEPIYVKGKKEKIVVHEVLGRK